MARLEISDDDPSTLAIATCPWRSCDMNTLDLSTIYLSVGVSPNTPIGHVVQNRATHQEYSFRTATVWVNKEHGGDSDHLCGKITVDETAYSHLSELYTVWCDGAVGKYVTVKLETHNVPTQLWGTDVLHAQPYLGLAEIIPFARQPPLPRSHPLLRGMAVFTVTLTVTVSEVLSRRVEGIKSGFITEGGSSETANSDAQKYW